MYHVELRQFPHNMCHFNLSERELLDTIVGAWARGAVDRDGRTQMEPAPGQADRARGSTSAARGAGDGPRLAQCTASERGRDRARAGAGRARPAQARRSAHRRRGRRAPTEQLLALLGSDPAALLAAWRLTAERRPSSRRASRSRWPKRRCARWTRASTEPTLHSGTPVVGVAQLVELRIVVPAVAGSIPVAHPKGKPC